MEGDPLCHSGASAQGFARRVNADAFAAAVRDEWAVFAVADGVSSLPHSAEAARLACEAVVGTEPAREESPVAFLARAVERAHGALDPAQSRGRSWATTLTLALVRGSRVAVGLVGDSTPAFVGQSGKPRFLLVPENDPHAPNVLHRAMNGRDLHRPQAVELEREPGWLVLATDGIWAVLSLEGVAAFLAELPCADAAGALVRRAQSAGTDDDATALVIEL